MINTNIAIEVTHISKKYRLHLEKPTLIKTLFGLQKKQEFWALKDINFTVNRGETIGIIGPNGAGKSTLLKILAGITHPSSGSFKIVGRIASLIELGSGFHPDLTGQENIYLNALLLGLSKKEVETKYSAIVDFADLGQFINQPLLTYSTGMMMRLGFSVAIHTDPEILIIDEILAVGDGLYQKKCINKINDLKKKGKTILFVSHNLPLTISLCQRSLLLYQGKLKLLTDTRKTITAYQQIISAKEKR